MKNKLFAGKAKTLIMLFLFLWLLVFGRLFYLQVIRSEEISKETKGKQLRLLPLESRRGNILDREGRVLATDLKMFTLYARKSLIRNPRTVARKLAGYSLGSEDRLLELLKDDAEFIRIARGISDSLVNKIQLDGVYAVKEWYRFYPSDLLGRTVLGSLNWKREGILGVEREYDEVLKGEDGWAHFLEVPRYSGISLLKRSEDEHKDPLEGHDVYLTIDMDIQYIMHEELEAVRKKTGADQVMGICVSVKTGEVLAMVNFPEFDPNKGWRLNACTSWEFEPGSVFKLIPAFAYINKGFSITDTLVDSTTIEFGGKLFKDPHPHHTYSFKEALINSSNVGFIAVGEKVGKRDLYNAARLFGMGCESGVDLPVEYSGQLPHLPRGRDIRLATVSFGQGVSVTPLQMVMAYQAVANDGVLLRPRIMSKICRNNRLIRSSRREKIRRIGNSKSCKTLLDILHGTVTEGTAVSASVSLISIAGKTGTAWKVKDGKYVNGKYISSFIGVFPYPEPEYVLGIFVDNIGSPYYYASQTACPVFKEIVRRIITHKGYRERFL
jgi:stage V sporulation protein D (sporulation-specific penicillin-binding protein)